MDNADNMVVRCRDLSEDDLPPEDFGEEELPNDLCDALRDALEKGMNGLSPDEQFVRDMRTRMGESWFEKYKQVKRLKQVAFNSMRAARHRMRAAQRVFRQAMRHIAEDATDVSEWMAFNLLARVWYNDTNEVGALDSLKRDFYDVKHLRFIASCIGNGDAPIEILEHLRESDPYEGSERKGKGMP